MFYIVSSAVIVFMIYIITQIIIPNTNKNYEFAKEIVGLYKTLPSNYFHEQSNEFMDQVNEICENYDVDDEGIAKNKSRRKSPNCKQLKRTFIIYCFIVTCLLLIPFMTVFIYKPECENLMNFLTNQAKRAYYISTVSQYSMELLVKDRYYYKEGHEIAKFAEHYNILLKLENNIKSGKYGGKSSSDYSIFDRVNGNSPGCVRSRYQDIEMICSQREFNELYTEELSNTSTSYMMVEFLNKAKELLDNPPECRHDLTDQKELYKVVMEIENSSYLNFSQVWDLILLDMLIILVKKAQYTY